MSDYFLRVLLHQIYNSIYCFVNLLHYILLCIIVSLLSKHVIKVIIFCIDVEFLNQEKKLS